MLKSQRKKGSVKPGSAPAPAQAPERPPMVDLVDGVDTSLRELEIPAGADRGPLRPWAGRRLISRYDTPERAARRIVEVQARAIRVLVAAAGPSMRLLSPQERTERAAAFMAREVAAPVIEVST